jgi:carboxypeptidase Taq
VSLKKIQAHLLEYSYLKSIHSLLYWDLETMMPAGAIEDRARRLSYVQKKLHHHITSKKYSRLLKELEQQKLSAKEKKLLSALQWDYDLQKALPSDHVTELSMASTHATHVWSKAKKENDWKSFRPHLQKLIDLKRREASYFKVKKPYDALIRLHDKEFTSDDITKLFKKLRERLVILAPEVKQDGRFVKVKNLKGPFPLEAQKDLSLFIASVFGLPEVNSRLDVSTHPFSINISPQDQRITTRYEQSHLDSLSSTMHEVGHALYELHLPAKWEGTPFQEAVSLSVHESQSRFWENVIGRSRNFCKFLHPYMKKHFPQSMKGINAETLFWYFNKSVPGLIRVESSELYYNLHIIIRYEIEEMIFNQGMNAKDIPAIWKEKYRDYLGVMPKNDAEGILQDSHWAGGAFGYFPTYTLGNLISGSLYKRIKDEMPDFDQHLLQGNLRPVLDFLIKHIYSKGRSITTKELIGELGVDDYLDYLQEKFKR